MQSTKKSIKQTMQGLVKLVFKFEKNSNEHNSDMQQLTHWFRLLTIHIWALHIGLSSVSSECIWDQTLVLHPDYTTSDYYNRLANHSHLLTCDDHCPFVHHEHSNYVLATDRYRFSMPNPQPPFLMAFFLPLLPRTPPTMSPPPRQKIRFPVSCLVDGSVGIDSGTVSSRERLTMLPLMVFLSRVSFVRLVFPVWRLPSTFVSPLWL